MVDGDLHAAPDLYSLQARFAPDSSMNIFASEESFWNAYRRKLAVLLREEENAPDFGLGAFVLVCHAVGATKIGHTCHT